MCVAFIKRHHGKVLIALNRDEFYARPTKPLSYIEDKKAYAGVDERYGGTWFVVDQLGRFAFVTNIRGKDLIKEDAPTRGEIPFNALEAEADFLDNAKDFNPFNVVWGSKDKICYFNNVEMKELEFKEELISITNTTHPATWPKAQKGMEKFEKIKLEWDDEQIFEKSFEIMKDSTSYDFVAPNTGFDEEMEKSLTPIFLELRDYGTVSTTVVLIGADGIRIDEKRYPSGEHHKFIIRPR